MILSIVRHGQTYYNAAGLVQGRIDIPLNENGKQQAKALGEALKQRGEHYDIIMASPLSRAYETAKIIAKELDYHHSILLNDRFVERDFHHLDGTPVETAMPLVRSKNYSHGAYETDTMLIERIKRAAMDLYHKYPDQSILLIAHSHVIKALMISAHPDQYTFADLIKHADVIHFEITQDMITVIKEKKA